MNRSHHQSPDDPRHRSLDQVLAALRNTHPPAGMERRILDRLQQQAPARSTFGSRRLTPLWLTTPRTRSLGFGLALAAVVVAALTLPATHRARPTRNHPSPQPPRTATPELTAQTTPAATHLAPKPKRRPAVPTPNQETLALEELHAPSLPAPPMPLTRQEKLLLRVAHKGDPEPLTALNGELRAKAEAQQKKDFDTFFGKPDKSSAGQSE